MQKLARGTVQYFNKTTSSLKSVVTVTSQRILSMHWGDDMGRNILLKCGLQMLAILTCCLRIIKILQYPTWLIDTINYGQFYYITFYAGLLSMDCANSSGACEVPVHARTIRCKSCMFWSTFSKVFAQS